MILDTSHCKKTSFVNHDTKYTECIYGTWIGENFIIFRRMKKLNRTHGYTIDSLALRAPRATRWVRNDDDDDDEMVESISGPGA